MGFFDFEILLDNDIFEIYARISMEKRSYLTIKKKGGGAGGISWAQRTWRRKWSRQTTKREKERRLGNSGK